MRTVIQRKNYLISRDLNAGTGVTWSQDVDIEFIPHEVIVKSILYIQDATTNNTDYLTGNLVNYDPMCFISDSVVQHNPMIAFQMNKQIRGRYNFEVRKADNSPSTATGKLMVILEFLQYDK